MGGCSYFSCSSSLLTMTPIDILTKMFRTALASSFGRDHDEVFCFINIELETLDHRGRRSVERRRRRRRFIQFSTVCPTKQGEEISLTDCSLIRRCQRTLMNRDASLPIHLGAPADYMVSLHNRDHDRFHSPEPSSILHGMDEPSSRAPMTNSATT